MNSKTELIKKVELEIQSMDQFKVTSESLLKNEDKAGIKAIRKAMKSKVNGLKEQINVLQKEKKGHKKQLRSNIAPIASNTYGLPENANTAFVLGS